MAIIESVTVAGQIPIIVAAMALAAVKNRTIITRLCRRDYEEEIAGFGDTVNVPITPTDSVAGFLVDGDPVSFQSNAIPNAQIVLNRQVYAAFQMTEIARMFARPDINLIHSNARFAAIANKVDSDTLAQVYPLFTSGPVGTFGVAPTDDTLGDANLALVNARVPDGEEWNLVVSPKTFQDLRKVGRLVEYRSAGEPAVGAIMRGELAGAGTPGPNGRRMGQAANFSVYQDQGVTVIPGAPDQHNNIAFARDGILMAHRPIRMPMLETGVLASQVVVDDFPVQVLMQFNISNVMESTVIRSLYGATAGRPEFGLVVAA